MSRSPDDAAFVKTGAGTLDARAMLISIAIYFGGNGVALAQNSQADQAELLRNQIAPPFAPSSVASPISANTTGSNETDHDLGEQEILRRIIGYQPWILSINSPVFYTSNVGLTDQNMVADLVEAPLAAIYFQPRLTEMLYSNLDVRQQFFFYDKYTNRNFGSMDAEAGLTYFLAAVHNLTLHGGYDFNLLTNSDLREFFDNHAILVNAEMPFAFARAQQISFGLGANVSVAADHQSPRRNDYEGYVGYSLSLSRSFALSALGRIVGRVYHQNQRSDRSEIVSLAADYRIAPWCTVSANPSFAWNESNQSIFDYSVANVGGAVSLTIRF